MEQVISKAGLTATISDHAGRLSRLTANGDDLIVPWPENDGFPPGFHGAVLFPWPNRLDKGRFRWRGSTYQVPLNEPARENANHGFAFQTVWDVVETQPAYVTLRYQTPRKASFPSRLQLDLTYEVETGLDVTAVVTNVGDVSAPYGLGFHPWLSPGRFSLDECRVQASLAAWVRADQRLLPLAEDPVPQEFDFAEGRSLTGAILDDGFVAAEPRTVRLQRPDGTAVECWMDAPFTCWQLTTGDFDSLGALKRAGFAAEPMTCTANALATGKRLRSLEPGHAETLKWGVRLARL